MKLKSGHEVVPATEEEMEKIKKNFPYYNKGIIRLNPGGWFFLPPFVDYADRIYDFKFRSSDVLINTWPKCGTTWTQEIVWTMRNNVNFDHPLTSFPIELRSPFIEIDTIIDNVSGDPEFAGYAARKRELFTHIHSGKVPENGINLQMAESAPDPRTIKTHLSFTLLSPDVLDTCKVIYVARNPKDVCLSYLHHHRIINFMKFEGDLDEFIDYFVNDNLVHSGYWAHIKEGWEKRNHPNFHWIFFEDMKSDPMKEMSRLNEFLGTNLSHEQMEKIVDYTKFENMKTRNVVIGSAPDDKESSMHKPGTKEGSFFRKGKAGDWKDKFTPEQNKKLDDWIKTNNEGWDIPFKYSL